MMAGNKHILTGDNLTGYSCSLCKHAWAREYTLDEIMSSHCEPHHDGRLVYHTRIDSLPIDNLLPKHLQCPPYYETPQERKGSVLIDRWLKGG